MAKIPINGEKFPIEWGSSVVGGQNQGDSIPSNEIIVWGNNSYTWGDVAFIQEVVDGLGTGRRRERQDRLDKLDKEKKKRLIRLICRIKGEKVYDDVTEVGDVKIDIDDVEMVAESIIGKVKLEIKSGV